MPVHQNDFPCISKSLRAASALTLWLAFGLGAQPSTHENSHLRRPEKTTAPAPVVLWRNPTDIKLRDLRYGEGGERHAPHTTVFAFVKEDLDGTIPKFVVIDNTGSQRTVKLGAEAKLEVAASRLVWAVGYFANEDY
jgi:hypothetical protein